jgi:hypothetical protein
LRYHKQTRPPDNIYILYYIIKEIWRKKRVSKNKNPSNKNTDFSINELCTVHSSPIQVPHNDCFFVCRCLLLMCIFLVVCLIVILPVEINFIRWLVVFFCRSVGWLVYIWPSKNGWSEEVTNKKKWDDWACNISFINWYYYDCWLLSLGCVLCIVWSWFFVVLVIHYSFFFVSVYIHFCCTTAFDILIHIKRERAREMNKKSIE